MTKAIITGGCGFFGHHLVEHILKNTDWEIIIFDKLNYASRGLERLRDIEVYQNPDYAKRVKVFTVDLATGIEIGVIKEVGEVDYIFHIAAESHVDRSIENPIPFIKNNVMMTMNMLDYARTMPNLKRFINFSTDEVYGTAPDGYSFKETDRHHPRNPYAASKSAQEQVGFAWAVTYGVPVVTTNTMNLFGQRQDKEKFIPLVINKILNGETVKIHGDLKTGMAGTRMWIHCRNVADALLHIIKLPYKECDVFNIVGLAEIDNLTLAKKIAKIMNKELKFELVDANQARSGHDWRYALDNTKLLNTGYIYPKDIDESLKETVLWELNRKDKWL